MFLDLLKKTCVIGALLVAFSYAQAQEANDTTSAESGADLSAVADTAAGWTFGSERSVTFVGLVMTHYVLKNSRDARDWPLMWFPFPFYVSQSFKAERDFGKLLGVKGEVVGTLSVLDLAFSAEVGFSLIHLLEFGVFGRIGSAWNYNEDAIFMGLYEPEWGDFRRLTFLMDYVYNVQYKAGLTLPLLAFLPKSDWTKIIVRLGWNLEYIGFTGADDGGLWRAGVETSVNGYRTRENVTLIYILPFQYFKMFMVSVSRNGFLHDSDFDEVYQPYDPDFRTVSVMPMLQFSFSEKLGGMAMLMIGRERKFENDDFIGSERFLQKRVGHEWALKMGMIMVTYKF